MSLDFTITQGLPAALRAEAARLYWQVFGGKLGRVMGPDAKAFRFLEQVIRADHALVALDFKGQLLGFAGFKTPAGGFAGGDWAALRHNYGLVGSILRAVPLALLSDEVDNQNFLLDGLCVHPEMRSQGIGRALLAAIEDEARARGYGSVRLDVIDSNWRARALYQRVGYEAVKTDRLSLALRLIFGFEASVTMVKVI